MKKLLLTLVGVICSLGMWAESQTTLISGVTLPGLPTGTYTVGTEVSHNGTNKAVVYDVNTAWAVMQAVVAGYGSPTTANFTWCNAYNSSDGSYSTTGATWDALDPFVGSAAYTTSGNSHYVNFARRGNVRKTDRTFAYRFTNARAVSAYVKSNGSKAGAGINLAVFLVANDGTQTEVEIVNDYTNTAKAITVEGLDEANTYVAYVYGDNNSNGELYEIAFKAPSTIDISSIVKKSQITEAIKWDFNTADVKTTLAETMNALEDHTYWSAVSSNQTYYQQSLSNSKLTIDGTEEIEVTKGLLFTSASTNRVGFNLSGGNLRFANSDCTITIPNLLAGDKIIVVGGRNGSSGDRGFSFTNVDIDTHTSADNTSWTAIPELTVTANGDVTITSINGVNITSIEIIPGPGTGATKLTLADDKEYNYDANLEGDVTINRTFAADGWYSICLPFALNAEQTAAVFSKVAAFDSQDGDNYNFTTVTAIEAGKPYIVQVEEQVANPVFEGVSISKDVTTSGETFVGLLNPTEVAAGYVIGSGTTVNPVNAGTIKGFRAYFPATASPAKSFSINGGEITAITAIDKDVKITGVAYNLAGQRVKANVNSFVIVNGKKFINK